MERVDRQHAATYGRRRPLRGCPLVDLAAVDPNVATLQYRLPLVAPGPRTAAAEDTGTCIYSASLAITRHALHCGSVRSFLFSTCRVLLMRS